MYTSYSNNNNNTNNNKENSTTNYQLINHSNIITIKDIINYNNQNNIIKKKKKICIKFYWNHDEDIKLLKLINIYNNNKIDWNKISYLMKNRTVKQCRERYYNYLNPNVNSSKWTIEEDELLLKLYKNYNTKWKKYLNHFYNRTTINIKNRFNYLFKKIIKQNNEKIQSHINNTNTQSISSSSCISSSNTCPCPSFTSSPPSSSSSSSSSNLCSSFTDSAISLPFPPSSNTNSISNYYSNTLNSYSNIECNNFPFESISNNYYPSSQIEDNSFSYPSPSHSYSLPCYSSENLYTPYNYHYHEFESTSNISSSYFLPYFSPPSTTSINHMSPSDSEYYTSFSQSQSQSMNLSTLNSEYNYQSNYEETNDIDYNRDEIDKIDRMQNEEDSELLFLDEYDKNNEENNIENVGFYNQVMNNIKHIESS